MTNNELTQYKLKLNFLYRILVAFLIFLIALGLILMYVFVGEDGLSQTSFCMLMGIAFSGLGVTAYRGVQYKQDTLKNNEIKIVDLNKD